MKAENQSEQESSGSDESERSHLEDVESGAGCVEIWERLSEKREE